MIADLKDMPTHALFQSSPYFNTHFYPQNPCFLYFLTPQSLFGTWTTPELPKPIQPIEIVQGRNCSQTMEETERVSKNQTNRLRKQKFEKIKVIESEAGSEIPTHHAESCTKKPLVEKSNPQGLDFGIQWKNQYRNIVPNLINQILSFLTKKCKSLPYLSHLMEHYPHPANWHLGKFYQYMRRIKDDISHYVDEKVIDYFFRLQDNSANIYESGEQEFYMMITRVAVMHYLRSEATVVSLTSPRMKKEKRGFHLIARRAILKKFREIAQQPNK